MSVESPLISVIVPVYNGADVLSRSLAAVVASDLPRDAWELIVVDDASTDDSAIIAGRHADTVVRLVGRPRGPAYARNRGLELARGSIIVSVDADVCVHSDAIGWLSRLLSEDATLGAVIGAYDAGDPSRPLISSFRNLRQSFLQQRAAGDVDNYWPACGAIRRSVLDQVGHFDEWHYWRPQAEGAELGQRIRRQGYRIVLDARVQATHLKEWTLASSITTDLVNHGVPSMRLLFQGRNLARMRSPSLSMREKANVAATCGALVLTALYLAFPIRYLGRLLFVDVAALTFGMAPLFGFIVDERDPMFALFCLPLQLLQYLTAGTSVILAWFLHQTVGEPRRDVTDDAFAEIGLDTWPPIPRRLASDAWKPPAESSAP
jgi:GT2 family glycosyltransferase